MRNTLLLAIVGLALVTPGCQSIGWPTGRAVYGTDILTNLEAKEETTQPVVAELPPPPAQPQPLPEPPPPPAPAPVVHAHAAPAPAPAYVAPAPRVARAPEPASARTEPRPVSKVHVVKKGDTLQKISTAYYGTTKRWMKIFEANRSILKSPDRIVEGMKLAIP